MFLHTYTFNKMSDNPSVGGIVSSALGESLWVAFYIFAFIVEVVLALVSGAAIGVMTSAQSTTENSSVLGFVLALIFTVFSLAMNLVTTFDNPQASKDAGGGEVKKLPFGWRFATWLIKAYIEAIVPLLIVCILLMVWRKASSWRSSSRGDRAVAPTATELHVMESIAAFEAPEGVTEGPPRYEANEFHADDTLETQPLNASKY